MTRYVIVPIVEGHGEVGAVPVLLNRWLRHRNFHRYFEVHVAGPVRASGKGALKVEHRRTRTRDRALRRDCPDEKARCDFRFTGC